MEVQLHHVLIFDVIGFVDKLADDVIVVVDVKNPEQLDFLLPDVRGQEFARMALTSFTSETSAS